MSLVSWLRRRERLVFPLFVAAAALVWLAAIFTHLYLVGRLDLSSSAFDEAWRFAVGGANDGLDRTLLRTSAWLGQSGAVVAAVYAYARYVDTGLFHLWVRWRLRDHVVVSGMNDKAATLVLDLLRQNRPVVLLDPRVDLDAADELRRAGARLVQGDPTSTAALERAGLRTAAALVAFTLDDEVDIRTGEAARRLMAGSRRRSPLQCIVHVQESSLRRLLGDSSPGFRRADGAMHARVFCADDRAAEALLREFPPDEVVVTVEPASPPVHVLVVGAGPLARALVHQLALTAHYVHGHRAIVTVVDPAASATIEKLEASFPGLLDQLELRVCDREVHALPPAEIRRLADGADGSIPAAAQAIVTIGQEVASIGAARHLARTLRPLKAGRARVVACVPARALVAQELDRGGLAADGIALFEPHRSCSAEAILSEALDRAARNSHELYLQRSLAAGQSMSAKPTLMPWNELEETVRDWNRHQIAHLGVKKRAVAALGSAAAASLERMAEMEHRRWMADLRLSGWTHGPRYDWDARTHPGLVPYAELDEGTREFDRAIIRGIVDDAAHCDGG